MTDERYSYVEDVKNRKNVAKSGGKKGKSRYGCTLPVDYMTTKEKQDANSRWISVTYGRPISLDKFLAYSDDDKKSIFKLLLTNMLEIPERLPRCLDALKQKLRFFVKTLELCITSNGKETRLCGKYFLHSMNSFVNP